MTLFSERLKKLRLLTDKNQAEIAEVIGASVQSYSAYESGREPKYEMLCALCDYFDVSADYLLGRIDTRSHALNDVAEFTGLTTRAIDFLQLLKNIDSHMPTRVLSYIIESADLDFYHDLYCFLLTDMYFFTPPAGDETPPFDEMYEQECLVAYSTGKKYETFGLNSEDLKDVYLNKIKKWLFELQDKAKESRVYKDIADGKI